MKVIAKKNRELALINAQNTQNENRAEIITLVVPEEYEDYNKKIVFVTDDGTVWDVITNNEYKITNAITKYDKVDFYIWLTKEVDGESIDFRTKTKTLSFYHNVDASDEITDEEIHGVNTVVNLLEEEIEKVENLNIEATKIGNTTTVTITKKDGTTESVEINDGVDGQDGQDGQNGKDGQDGKDAKINGKNSIEIEAGNNITIDNTETGIRINSTNDGGTTDYTDLENKPKINNVELSGNKSLNDLGIQPKGNYIEDNNYVHTDNNFNNTYKNKLEGLENYDDTEIKADISDIQDEQTEQNTEIEKLQTENARLKATLPTTGEITGQDVTLDKTAELEFKKPPLPMGNSEQGILPEQYQQVEYIESTGTQYINTNYTPVENDDINIEKVKNTGTGCLFSAGNSTNQLILLASSSTNYYWKYFATGNATAFFTEELSSFSTISTANGSISINNVVKASSTYAGTVDTTIQLFRRVNGESYATASIGRFTITNGNKTKLDLIPCYRISDNEVGMYDLVSNTFYTNAGTGTFNKGNNTPNPNYEQPITNVTGDVEVKVQNKNLFDKDNVINAYLNADGTTTSNNTFRVSDYINIKGLDNITISGNYGGSELCCFYDRNKEFISSFGMGSLTTRVASVPTNAEYVRVTVRQDVINKYQLEQGSTSTPYTPHKEQVFIFPLGNEKLMLGDYLADDGIHHVRGQKKYMGTETWWEYSSLALDNTRVFALTNNIAPKNSNCLSNYFNTSMTGWGNLTQIDKEILQIYSDKQVYIRISKDRANNLTDFKTWLSTHNTIVEYELEEEVIVPYTSAQQEIYNQIKQALSYEEQTNISSNQNALFSVEAYQDIKEKIEEAGGHTHNNKAVLDGISSADITRWNNKSDFSGDYNDLSNKPTIPDVSGFITKDVNNLTNYTLKTNTGSLIDLEINNTTYVVTMKLKDVDGNVISTDTIDLPLETVVVSGRYDNTTKKVILTLENGSEVDFSVADLVAGLQTEITSSNKLASDLVDDTNSGNKFVTTSEKQTWNGKYDKPSTGIPKTDLASAVQTSLGKADTALQSHQDISGKANKISVVQTSASTIEINSNTFYKFGEVASLNITLASITDNTIYNEYMFEFVSGTTATTLTLPSSIKWLETPTIDANKIYQCSIVDNVGLLVGVANV